jgi:hypothetical protein
MPIGMPGPVIVSLKCRVLTGNAQVVHSACPRGAGLLQMTHSFGGNGFGGFTGGLLPWFEYECFWLAMGLLLPLLGPALLTIEQFDLWFALAGAAAESRAPGVVIDRDLSHLPWLGDRLGVRD